MTSALEARGAAILRHLPPGPVRVAEVGVLIGGLSAFLLGARADLSLVMVDNWASMADQPEAYIATNDDHALKDEQRAQRDERQARKVAAKYPGRATVIKANSVDAAAAIQPGSLDLVFLDADHSDEGVTADIAAWAQAVRPGGFLAGHDYANPDPKFRFGVTEAVDRWAAEWAHEVETDANFTWFVRL